MSESRNATIVNDLCKAFGEVMDTHNITHEEYREAVAFLAEVAESGETMLFFDALLEAQVVRHDTNAEQAQVLGPYYLPDAPVLADGVLASGDEPGDRLVVSGVVQDADGNGIPGAVLDIWQSDAQGRYADFDPGIAPGNLRGKVVADDQGSYRLDTVVPAPYQIPHQGPTGRMLQLRGRHPWRPAHIHMIVSAEGHQPLTTQVYFEGDPYVESDSVDAARPELIFPLQDSGQGKALTFNPVLASA